MSHIAKPRCEATVGRNVQGGVLKNLIRCRKRATRSADLLSFGSTYCAGCARRRLRGET